MWLKIIVRINVVITVFFIAAFGKAGVFSKEPEGHLDPTAKKQLRREEKQKAAGIQKKEFDATPFEAVKRGEVEILKTWLERSDVDINQANPAGGTLLIHAISSLQPSLVEILLKHGIDTSIQDSKGFTALHWTIPALFNGGNKYRPMFDMVLAASDDDVVDLPANEGTTALLMATAMLQNEDLAFHVVQALINRGADVNVENNGLTPLINVCLKGYLRVALLLLEKGADPYAVNKNGNSFYSIMNQQQPQWLQQNKVLQKIFPQYGIDMNNELIKAVISGSKTSIIKSLLKNGASANAVDDEGMSVVMYAVLSKNLLALHVLLKAGADINQKNTQGDTALILAVKRANKESVAELIRFSADVSIANNGGVTALIWAAYNCNVAIAVMLIDALADPFVNNSRGLSFESTAKHGEDKCPKFWQNPQLQAAIARYKKSVGMVEPKAEVVEIRLTTEETKRPAETPEPRETPAVVATPARAIVLEKAKEVIHQPAIISVAPPRAFKPVKSKKPARFVPQKVTKVEKALVQLGFTPKKGTGSSHVTWKDGKGHHFTLAAHDKSAELSQPTLNGIAKSMGMDPQDFYNMILEV